MYVHPHNIQIITSNYTILNHYTIHLKTHNTQL